MAAFHCLDSLPFPSSPGLGSLSSYVQDREFILNCIRAFLSLCEYLCTESCLSTLISTSCSALVVDCLSLSGCAQYSSDDCSWISFVSMSQSIIFSGDGLNDVNWHFGRPLLSPYDSGMAFSRCEYIFLNIACFVVIFFSSRKKYTWYNLSNVPKYTTICARSCILDFSSGDACGQTNYIQILLF